MVRADSADFWQRQRSGAESFSSRSLLTKATGEGYTQIARKHRQQFARSPPWAERTVKPSSLLPKREAWGEPRLSIPDLQSDGQGWMPKSSTDQGRGLLRRQHAFAVRCPAEKHRETLKEVKLLGVLAVKPVPMTNWG